MTIGSASVVRSALSPLCSAQLRLSNNSYLLEIGVDEQGRGRAWTQDDSACKSSSKFGRQPKTEELTCVILESTTANFGHRKPSWKLASADPCKRQIPLVLQRRSQFHLPLRNSLSAPSSVVRPRVQFSEYILCPLSFLASLTSRIRVPTMPAKGNIGKEHGRGQKCQRKGRE